jgi:hypothetical protein
MDTYFTMLRNFMSMILGVIKDRKSQNKRTEDEGYGIRCCAWLGKWIKENTEEVKAAIANDTQMFEMIMKQATRTLRAYIKTGVWNKVYWVKDEIGLYGRIYFVWTPEDGKTLNSTEERRFKSEIIKAQKLLHNRGYHVLGLDEDGFEYHLFEYHLDENGYFTRGKPKAAEKALETYVFVTSGNVFHLLANFLGHDLQPYALVPGYQYE